MDDEELDEYLDCLLGPTEAAPTEAAPTEAAPTEATPPEAAPSEAMPPALFTPAEELPGLGGGAVVYYRPAFLGPGVADAAFNALRPGGAAGIAWSRRRVVVYGREVSERRDTAFYGSEGTSYRYSGKAHEPLAWDADPTGTLEALLGAARAATGIPFNFVLLNWYEPADCIGPHSDDERDLVPGSGIFSVSLGRPRSFVLEAKSPAAGGPGVTLRLPHGSALWMAGRTQSAYKHEVPAERVRSSEKGPTGRVNLTFRCVVVR